MLDLDHETTRYTKLAMQSGQHAKWPGPVSGQKETGRKKEKAGRGEHRDATGISGF